MSTQTGSRLWQAVKKRWSAVFSSSFAVQRTLKSASGLEDPGALHPIEKAPIPRMEAFSD